MLPLPSPVNACIYYNTFFNLVKPVENTWYSYSIILLVCLFTGYWHDFLYLLIVEVFCMEIFHYLCVRSGSYYNSFLQRNKSLATTKVVVFNSVSCLLYIEVNHHTLRKCTSGGNGTSMEEIYWNCLRKKYNIYTCIYT